MDNSKDLVGLMKKLPPRKARFVKSYLVCGVAVTAYREAGYLGGYPEKNACKLMRDKKILAAIDAGKAELAIEAKYNQKKAMLELDDAMGFAKKTNNAGALAKCIELKAKMTGLLVDKLDMRHLGSFQVNIGGIDQPARSIN